MSNEVTNIVKTSSDAETGWRRLLKLCEETNPNELWSHLPAPTPREDVDGASRWLKQQLRKKAAPNPVKGIYLGLDTLNMAGRDGHNLEIGATKDCDPFALETDWAWHCEWYGDRHLIRSLRNLKKVYDKPQFESVSGFADYALFLGYSGLVLADAIETLDVNSPLLVAWGFHDGDLFFLGRRDKKKFERICEVF